MSRNDWESGTIRLPSAEFARLRKVVEVSDRTRKERMFSQSQTFWKGLTRKQQTDQDEYQKAVTAFTSALHNVGSRPATYGFYERPAILGPNADIADYLRWRLQDVARGTYGTDRVWIPGKPRRVLPADMDYPTNRTTSFLAGEGAISFNKDTSSVHWGTGENNHAVESAHGSGPRSPRL